MDSKFNSTIGIGTSYAEDVLTEVVLSHQLKQPERKIVFMVKNGKTKLKIPRETFGSVLNELIRLYELFPLKRPLIIRGELRDRRYMLSLIDSASELLEGQVKALKHYRNSITGAGCDKHIALRRVRLMVECYGGQLQLQTDSPQGFHVNLILPHESLTAWSPA